jgi:hypothetical protein
LTPPKCNPIDLEAVFLALLAGAAAGLLSITLGFVVAGGLLYLAGVL